MADLSQSMLVTLKNDITVTNRDVMWKGQTLFTWYGREEWQIVADWYQELKAPEKLIWRPDILPEEMACVIDTEEIEAAAAPSEATHRTWTIKIGLWGIITRVPAVNATDRQTQKNFDSLFGPQSNPAAPKTYVNLSAVAQREATNGEDLYTDMPGGGTSISEIYGQAITDVNVREGKVVQ